MSSCCRCITVLFIGRRRRRWLARPAGTLAAVGAVCWHGLCAPGPAGARRGVPGCEDGGLCGALRCRTRCRGCLSGIPLVPGSDGFFVPCKASDGGQKFCPLEGSRGRSSGAAPVFREGLVMEALLPASPPLHFLLWLLRGTENNHDKSETLPRSRRGAAESG